MTLEIAAGGDVIFAAFLLPTPFPVPLSRFIPPLLLFFESDSEQEKRSLVRPRHV